LKKIFLILILMTLAGCAVERQVVEEQPTEQPTRSASRAANISQPENTSPPENTSQQINISHYETKFDENDTNRNTNMAIAANSIDGKIINPGESFSFNETIGSTIKSRGYKRSIIFVGGGRKSTGYGGGVCQVSTTLCNAAAQAGMTITERHDHSRRVAYVGDGMEAATSNSGKLDFKFQNDKPYPVVIRATAENGTVRVSVGECHGY